jgi:hypothetical protein
MKKKKKKKKKKNDAAPQLAGRFGCLCTTIGYASISPKSIGFEEQMTRKSINRKSISRNSISRKSINGNKPTL